MVSVKIVTLQTRRPATALRERLVGWQHGVFAEIHILVAFGTETLRYRKPHTMVFSVTARTFMGRNSIASRLKPRFKKSLDRMPISRSIMAVETYVAADPLGTELLVVFQCNERSPGSL